MLPLKVLLPSVVGCGCGGGGADEEQAAVKMLLPSFVVAVAVVPTKSKLP